MKNLTNLKNNRIKWVGYLKRMQEEILPNRMLNLKVTGKQPREDHGKMDNP